MPDMKHYSSFQFFLLMVDIAAYLFPEFQLMWLVEATKRNLPRELYFLYEGKTKIPSEECLTTFHGSQIFVQLQCT